MRQMLLQLFHRRGQRWIGWSRKALRRMGCCANEVVARRVRTEVRLRKDSGLWDEPSMLSVRVRSQYARIPPGLHSKAVDSKHRVEVGIHRSPSIWAT